MKLVFFKRPKNKQFDYKPIYFDQEKEEREQRKRELGIDGKKDHRSFYKGELQRNWRSNKVAREKTSRMRSMIYLIFLLFAVYYIFFTDIVQNFVTKFIP